MEKEASFSEMSKDVHRRAQPDRQRGSTDFSLSVVLSDSLSPRGGTEGRGLSRTCLKGLLTCCYVGLASACLDGSTLKSRCTRDEDCNAGRVCEETFCRDVPNAFASPGAAGGGGTAATASGAVGGAGGSPATAGAGLVGSGGASIAAMSGGVGGTASTASPGVGGTASTASPGLGGAGGNPADAGVGGKAAGGANASTAGGAVGGAGRTPASASTGLIDGGAEEVAATSTSLGDSEEAGREAASPPHDAGGNDAVSEVRPSPSTIKRQAKIAAKYSENNNYQWLGSAISYDDLNPAGGRTLYEGGSIFYSDAADAAHVLFGAIARKYLALHAQSWKGYPENDEQDTWNYDGRWNSFEGGASIYYKLGADEAYSVQGLIRDVWSWLQYETGPLGYPVTDEYTTTTGCASRFENGGIYLRSDDAPGQPSAVVSIWPVMYQSTLEHPGTPMDPNAATLSVELVDHESGWTVKASGTNWTPRARIRLSINHTNHYTQIAANGGGDGIEVQAKGTFSYDQANSSGQYVPFADCVAVNNIVSIQATEVGGPAPRIAVVGLARPSNCNQSQDP